MRQMYKNLDFGTFFLDQPKIRGYFGLPAVFPTAEYLRKYHAVVAPVTLESYQDVVSLHYRRNEDVRQDVFMPDGSRKTEFLRYPLTDAFKVLRPLNEGMTFLYHAPSM